MNLELISITPPCYSTPNCHLHLHVCLIINHYPPSLSHQTTAHYSSP